jgi:hypothetical protein
MSLAELIEKIHQLTPDEQDVLRRELDNLQEADLEETPKMLAAIDEGIRSAEKGPNITLDELSTQRLRPSKSSASGTLRGIRVACA